MGKSIVTTIAIKKMLEARAGIAPLPSIVGMAFGDGAVQNGAVEPPDAGYPVFEARAVQTGKRRLSDHIRHLYPLYLYAGKEHIERQQD